MLLLVLICSWIIYFFSCCRVSVICFFFFFKQKTAYEMRISDWSSDVCSSDLLVLVSSLAAREPGLSHYAASKAAGEQALRASGVRNWVVVRPSAIYGPWDRETLAFFRAAAGPVLPVLGGGGARICLVHAADAAGAIVALCRDGPDRKSTRLNSSH